MVGLGMQQHQSKFCWNKYNLSMHQSLGNLTPQVQSMKL